MCLQQSNKLHLMRLCILPPASSVENFFSLYIIILPCFDFILYFNHLHLMHNNAKFSYHYDHFNLWDLLHLSLELNWNCRFSLFSKENDKVIIQKNCIDVIFILCWSSNFKWTIYTIIQHRDVYLIETVFETSTSNINFVIFFTSLSTM